MKFSVIIPVHNAEKTITRCVDSLITNTFCDFEIVAVEDGSSDKSWEVLCELAEKYPRLKIFKNDKNRGVSYTRNRGLDQAKGDYICFTDSDDWVEPAYLQAFSDALEKAEDALPICGFVNHDEKYNGRCDEYRWGEAVAMRLVSLKEELENLHRHTLLQQLWNKAFNANMIKTAGVRFDESISIGEDFRFVLTYLRCIGYTKAVLINQSLYHYMRDQSGSLMYQVGIDPVEEQFMNMKMLYDLMGGDERERALRIQNEKQTIIESQAYLIFHNVGMSLKEKRRRIISLDPDQGRSLYKKAFVVYLKEHIVSILKSWK